MPELGVEQFNLPARGRATAGSRLWREWCFARAAFRQFRIKFLLLGGLLLGGGMLFRLLEPEKQHSLPRAVYYTWVLVFGQPPEEFPSSAILQALFFIVPVLGLGIILEGLVDFALIVRDRRRNERSWCTIMAAALSNHVILVGLGKLGFRTYCLLRQLGEAVVVIEGNEHNQFLDDVRRDGAPLFIGDGRREAFLVDAHAATAKSIILATNHDLVNLEIALDARRINPQIRVVLRMFDQNMADKIREGFNIQVAMSQSALSAPAFVGRGAGRGHRQHAGDRRATPGDRAVGGARGGPVVRKGRGGGDGPITAWPWWSAARAGAEPQLMPPPDTQLVAGDELLVQGTFPALSRLRAHIAGLALPTRG